MSGCKLAVTCKLALTRSVNPSEINVTCSAVFIRPRVRDKQEKYCRVAKQVKTPPGLVLHTRTSHDAVNTEVYGLGKLLSAQKCLRDFFFYCTFSI